MMNFCTTMFQQQLLQQQSMSRDNSQNINQVVNAFVHMNCHRETMISKFNPYPHNNGYNTNSSSGGNNMIPNSSMPITPMTPTGFPINFQSVPPVPNIPTSSLNVGCLNEMMNPNVSL
jgi:hypothetical protein